MKLYGIATDTDDGLGLWLFATREDYERGMIEQADGWALRLDEPKTFDTAAAAEEWLCSDEGSDTRDLDGITWDEIEVKHPLYDAAPAMLRALKEGCARVQRVNAAWESGDLAGAVRALNTWMDEQAGCAIAKATGAQS